MRSAPTKRGAGCVLFTVLVSGSPPLAASERIHCDEPSIAADATVPLARVTSSGQTVPILNNRPPVVAGKETATSVTGVTFEREKFEFSDRCPRLMDDCTSFNDLEDGRTVLIGRTLGDYTCVRDWADKGTGWVKSSSLTKLKPFQAVSSAWNGTYTKVGSSELSIKAEEDGKLSISGVVVGGVGHGPPGVVGYELSEIGLTQVRVGRGLVTLPVTEDVSASTKKDGTVTYTAGKLRTPPCHVRVRLQGPVLVIKDGAGCTGDKRSGFEGIWARVEGEEPRPRADHARTIELGR